MTDVDHRVLETADEEIDIPEYRQLRLRVERWRSRLTLAEAGKVVGQSRVYLNLVENGSVPLGEKLAYRLCNLYKIPLSQLFISAEERKQFATRYSEARQWRPPEDMDDLDEALHGIELVGEVEKGLIWYHASGKPVTSQGSGS